MSIAKSLSKLLGGTWQLDRTTMVWYCDDGMRHAYRDLEFRKGLYWPTDRIKVEGLGQNIVIKDGKIVQPKDTRLATKCVTTGVSQGIACNQLSCQWCYGERKVK